MTKLTPKYNIDFLIKSHKADLVLSDDIKEQLVTITALNINARYDTYKMSFKKQCIGFPDYLNE